MVLVGTTAGLLGRATSRQLNTSPTRPVGPPGARSSFVIIVYLFYFVNKKLFKCQNTLV